jgi:uncharacterized protein
LNNYLHELPGQNSWKRYLSSFIVISLFLSLGSILYVVFNLLFGKESSYLDDSTGEFVGLNPTMDVLFSHLINLGWLFGIWLAMRYIHKRTIISLVTSNTRVDWKQILWGFSVYFVLFLGFKVIDFLIFPNRYLLNDVKWGEFLLLFIIVLLFVPIQTTVEELFFRGYLLQWLAKKISNPIVLSILVAIIFGSLHFSNPEMEQSAFWIGLNYTFAGFMFTLIAIKMGSSELSIGAHAANNMFLLWFIADEESTNGAVPSLLKVTESNPTVSFIYSVFVLFIFYKLSIKKFKDVG